MNYHFDKGLSQIPRSSYEKLKQVNTFSQSCGEGPNGSPMLMSHGL